jgi:hypothetical protein
MPITRRGLNDMYLVKQKIEKQRQIKEFVERFVSAVLRENELGNTTYTGSLHKYSPESVDSIVQEIKEYFIDSTINVKEFMNSNSDKVDSTVITIDWKI